MDKEVLIHSKFMIDNKYILLVGEWASSNLGDQVLCTCVENKIYEMFPTINTRRFDISYGLSYDYKKKIKWFPYRLYFKISNNVKKREFCYGKIKANWIKSDLDSIKTKIKAIVFCGGQMFMDYFVYQIEAVVKFARLNNIPILYNACGGGKCSQISIEIFRKCLSNVESGMLTVRDSQLLFSRELQANPILVPDPALLSRSIIKNNTIKKNGKVGIGIQNPSGFKQHKIDKEQLIDILINLIIELSNNGIELELFTNGSQSDYDFIKEILGSNKIKKISIANTPKKGIDLIETIASYNKIISFRLHSHIIAYSCKVPSYGIIWDDKVKDFFSMTDNIKNCCELNSINIPKIVGFIEDGKTSFSRLESLQSQLEENLCLKINKLLKRDIL